MANQTDDSQGSASSNNDEGVSSSQNESLENVMESIVRISFAGLGGSIIGLGQKRRLESMRVLTGAAATAAARRKRLSPQMNMPWTMALSCMAFCAVIETSRLASPASMLFPSSLMQESDYDEASRRAITTVANFTIGGAVAGLAGSFGRTSQKRLPIVAPFRGSKRFFGLLPGIGLGLIFGSLQAASDYGIEHLENMRPQ